MTGTVDQCEGKVLLGGGNFTRLYHCALEGGRRSDYTKDVREGTQGTGNSRERADGSSGKELEAPREGTPGDN